MKQTAEIVTFVTVSAVCYLIKSFKTIETIRTRMTAPMIDGIIAIPAITGPQNPRRCSPSAEPIKPAMIFAIQLIEPRRFVSQPAIEPMTAPIIKT